jgi:hypothetical protein
MVSFRPMVLEKDADSARANDGEIAVSTDTMLTEAEAADLREGITQAFEGSTEEADKAVAADDDAARAVLAVLNLGSQGSKQWSYQSRFVYGSGRSRDQPAFRNSPLPS